MHLPDQCHWCFISIHDKKLCAVVCFYNVFSRYFELCDTIPKLDDRFAHIDGLICDWKNNSEFTLSEYILNIAEISVSDDEI